MSSRTVGIIQARMGSTRSPGKVLRIAAGKPLLHHLLDRLSFSQQLDEVVVATSTLAGDAPVVDLCKRLGVRCIRGSERDVLGRYHQAAHDVAAELVVRITADCPLIDPAIVDTVIEAQRSEPDSWDLVTNRHPLTFPDGLDVDVMPLESLDIADRYASTPEQREHVIPYFWEAGLRVRNVECYVNLFRKHRWTVDYEEDVQFVTHVIEALYVPGRIFGMNDILSFLGARAELSAINAKYLPTLGHT